MASRSKTSASKPTSTGLLVLGMHRSGTSALARVLQTGGADLGSRLLGASTGNEDGHFEDAFAVETHERLLAVMGRRWDDLVPLPRGWHNNRAVLDAHAMIADYIAGNRAQHKIWAVKDPRLCEFGGLWRDAAVQSRASLSAVIVFRHPWEVAQSLAARDGMAPGHAFMLWLEHCVGALQVTKGMSTAVLNYDMLLRDWRSCMERVNALPSMGALSWKGTRGSEVDRFLNPRHRHHKEGNQAADLPVLISEIWSMLLECTVRGAIPNGLADQVAARIAPVSELVMPLVGDWRVTERKLWERVDRAETLSAAASTDTATSLGNLEARVRLHHDAVIAALTGDIRHMQQMVADTLASVANQAMSTHTDEQVQSGLRAQLSALAKLFEDRLSEIETRGAAVHSLVDGLSNLLAGSHEQLQSEVETAYQQHAEHIASLGSNLTAAIGIEIRTMQNAAAAAGIAAARNEAAAQLAERLAPSMDLMTQRLAAIEASSATSLAAAGNSLASLQSAMGVETARQAQGMLQLADELGNTVGSQIDKLQANVELRMLEIDARLATVHDELSLQERLHEATARHAEAELSLQRSHSQVRMQQESLAAQELERRKLVSELEAKESRGQELEVALESSQEESVHLQRTLELRQQESSCLQLALESREEEVARLQLVLLSRQEQLFHLEAGMQAALSRAAELQVALASQVSQFESLERELGHHKEASTKLHRVLESRSWRWTRALRALARLARGQHGEGDRAALRAVARRVIAASPFLSSRTRLSLIERTLPRGEAVADPATLPDQEMAHMIVLQPAREGLADVFVWAVIDWHFRTQRPQHLARALASKGHRVFYISNNFVDSPDPGFRIDPLGGDGRLFQIHLHHEFAPAIYFAMPEPEQVERLRASLAYLLDWTCTQVSTSVVQHPYWSELVRALPNVRVVYDCMDHHAGFDDNAASVVAAEHKLVEDSDLVIVTSGWLEQEVGPRARATTVIRNAGEFEFFKMQPERVFADEQGRQVIGYYGAIAEWFDLQLVRSIAQANPDALVLLVGNDTTRAAQELQDLPNVSFTGEVPYAQLPYWLYGFDVCILPFRVIPLTLATNPVKIYEYLSAGKPVVAVDLPEMSQFHGLIEVASNADEFLLAIRRTLLDSRHPDAIAARQDFAAGQTWDHRAEALDHALTAIQEPRVSVIVLTYNNLAYTEACLFSIESYSDYSNLEVLVVDNASTDGSREWLRAWAAEPSAAGHLRRLILNEDNLGFSAGNNVGLRASTGEFLVILNNDTYVTPGWVRTLCAHLRRNPRLGLVGPVTNNIGNEARIEINYSDMSEMIAVAARYTRAHPGESMAMRNAAFFCVAMRRRLYEQVGDMDEAFGVGFFEDDDYCRRVELAGWRIACAEDVFIHHHLSASFDKLSADKKRELFERNKAIYESKWGPWLAHAYRPSHGASGR